MILIGRSGEKILKNYWLNGQADKLDYTRSVDVDQLSECRRSICCAAWVLHDSDFAERTARARFVETLFVCGTQKLEAYCVRFISGVFPKHRQHRCVFYQV